MTLKVAIVGSGPAGFYTAESLHDRAPDAEIDIIDRLPTPYGLIRAGVAPDHQSIKNVTRRYEATASEDTVHFIGNVEIGKAVTMAELRGFYDAVIVATGAPSDRGLDLPGDHLTGVVGSAAFVGWYNAHPDFAGLAPQLCAPSVVVIGNGNVALDCARILARTIDELAATDILNDARRGICTAPIEEIHIVGRRGPLQAAFTNKELAEFGKMERAVALVDPADLPAEDEVPPDLDGGTKKNLAILREFATNDPTSKPLRIRLQFYRQPREVLGETAATAVRFEHTRLDDEGRPVGTGVIEDLPANLVISCIGYKTLPIFGVPFDDRAGRFRNEDGFIEPGLYAAGWAKRGPSGTIGTNKPDGQRAADLVLEHHPGGGTGKPGGDGLRAVLAERGITPVRFVGWKKIEAAETAAAEGTSAPRQKFTVIEDMLRTVSDAAAEV